MMVNLFSCFDPATSLNLSLNWMSIMFFTMFMSSMFWFMPSRQLYFNFMIISKLNKELSMILSWKNKFLIMFSSILFFILCNNLMGLLPYIFTASSHLLFTLTLSMPLWLTFMIYGWMNKTNNMFLHLIPVGTPTILMPFMACIESISNMMRPISLAVRLMANMTAGHLLMSLLGNNSMNNMSIIYLLVLIQMMLMLFELAVAFIQSYVFTILSTLYLNEINYENKPPLPFSKC
uniref:ATP synthase subunit a n=1 Tax=Polytoxus fuscovittatus TaxID=1347745 RepID=A0A7I6H8H0_9HEMI|nr:ATP synthase F0 subunit 6 [Polytoxus fuscovittatus]